MIPNTWRKWRTCRRSLFPTVGVFGAPVVVVAFHRDEQYNDLEIIRYISHPDGRTERTGWAFPMRYYFRFELEHLLELSGFRVISLFGDFDRSAYQSDSPEMIFVAGHKED